MIIIADNKIQNALNNFGDMAKRKYNIAMFEHRLKNYKNELNSIFRKIGMLVYERKLTDDIDTIKLFASVEHYKNKISEIENYLENIKYPDNKTDEYFREKNVQSKIVQSKVVQSKSDYKKPTLGEHDLIMTRTSDGIKLVRFCTNCDNANDSGVSVCANCGHKISD